MNLFKKFLPLSSLSSPPANEEFTALMSWAERIQKTHGDNGIIELQRLVMGPIKANHMRSAIMNHDHGALPPLDSNCLGLGLHTIPTPNGDHTSLGKVISQLTGPLDTLTANLTLDIVIPTMWAPGSIENFIGNPKAVRPWKQDKNHKLCYWSNMNIYWVESGNHSITKGILNGTGSLQATSAFDTTPLYDLIHFDGTYWISKVTGEQLGRPLYNELGYIFELGRYLADSAVYGNSVCTK